MRRRGGKRGGWIGVNRAVAPRCICASPAFDPFPKPPKPCSSGSPTSHCSRPAAASLASAKVPWKSRPVGGRKLAASPLVPGSSLQGRVHAWRGKGWQHRPAWWGGGGWRGRVRARVGSSPSSTGTRTLHCGMRRARRRAATAACGRGRGHGRARARVCARCGGDVQLGPRGGPDAGAWPMAAQSHARPSEHAARKRVRGTPLMFGHAPAPGSRARGMLHELLGLHGDGSAHFLRRARALPVRGGEKGAGSGHLRAGHDGKALASCTAHAGPRVGTAKPPP